MTTDTVWKVPPPLARCEVRLDDDTLTTVRRHGNPESGTRLVLSHGSGLAVDLYYPFWSLFADDYDLVVFDFRNHGWNEVGAARDHNVPTLIHDHDLVLDAIDRTWGRKPTVGVFHSLSTLVSLLSFTKLYAALVLFDPPLCKPGADQIELHDAAERAAKQIRRRGHRFKTPEEFAEFLGYWPTFKRLLPGVLQLMAETTLRPCADGEGYELRCPREYEAQLMDYARSYFPLLDLDLLACPTKIIGADPTLPYAYLPTFNPSHAMSMDYDFVPDTSHSLQLEKPAECAAMLREFLERHGLA